jgi:mono/diheme cytochrome c family protein
MKHRYALIAAWAAALIAVGTMPSPGPVARAAPAVLTDVISATEQVDRGRALFQTHCSECHGQQGEGSSEAPALIAMPHPLKGHKTAQALFDFVSKEMPGNAPGTLQPQVYWDILAFILDANRLLPADTNLGPENAANVKVGD